MLYMFNKMLSCNTQPNSYVDYTTLYASNAKGKTLYLMKYLILTQSYRTLSIKVYYVLHVIFITGRMHVHVRDWHLHTNYTIFLHIGQNYIDLTHTCTIKNKKDHN